MTHYHFIGIGGAGLSAIARVLLEKGHPISGSDLVISPSAQELQELGVKVFTGHEAANIFGAEVVIRSSAITDDNVEVASALNAGIPVIKRVDFLSELTRGKRVIAIAGTHGKTTTTAMLAWCLSQMEMDPSFVIGGYAKNLNASAHAGSGDFFVIEADEYDGMFLGLTPEILVVTAIEHDHPDCYPTPETYFNAFLNVTNLIKPNGLLVADSDNPGASRLLNIADGSILKIAYGSKKSSDYVIKDVHHSAGCGVTFSLHGAVKSDQSLDIDNLTLIIPGSHNAHNASAALAVIHQLGLPAAEAAAALKTFSGTGRRYDVKGIFNGVTIIDDYAHHPTEIKATLSAARCQYPNRQIWAVWQPHTYSRTRELAQDFKDAFDESDHVIVTDIFASREKPQPYSSYEVVKMMRHTDARQIKKLDDVSAFLKDHLAPSDVLLVLSAGDADKISRDVIASLTTGEDSQ